MVPKLLIEVTVLSLYLEENICNDIRLFPTSSLFLSPLLPLFTFIAELSGFGDVMILSEQQLSFESPEALTDECKQ